MGDLNEVPAAKTAKTGGIDRHAFEQAAKASGATSHRTNNRWDPHTKAAALAILAANGGNVKRSVRIMAEQMGIHVPRKTLTNWAEDPEKAAPEELRTAANEALANVFEAATMKFAVLLASDEVIAQMAASSPRDLAVSAKVTIEAMQLLRGKPTSIAAGDPYSALLLRVAGEIKGKGDASAPPPAE